MSSVATERLIAALDLPALAEAERMVEELSGVCTRFKVGLELFCTVGPRAVEAVRALGGRVFLDLKLHDIPETVRRAARAASATGAELLTVHVAGGRTMLEAAVAGAREGGGGRVLGVTVLTSLDAAELAAVGTVTASVEELVVARAQLAQAAGCDGVIASPSEAAAVRAATGTGFLVVTPGVRAAGDAAGDQRRTASARQAIAAGADAVVAGRAIRDAKDRRAAALALLAELS